MPSSINYQSNSSIKAFLNNISLIEFDNPLHKYINVYQVRKYNSSGNIKNDYIINNNTPNQTQGKNNKIESKKKKSSLFLNKSVNKAERDIRDFKRFCDGLKCELDHYICSQIGSR